MIPFPNSIGPSQLNIFTKTVHVGREGSLGGIYYEVPNWPVIILFAILAIAIITTCLVLIYFKWRKNNCCPIYFAGKVKYARKGHTIANACELPSDYGGNWLIVRHRELTAAGFKINGLFSDPALTKPLNKDQIVNGPVHIFPKLQK